MTRSSQQEVATVAGATTPDELGRLFLQRANAGDTDGLAALYEPDAVLAFPAGATTVGRDAIRRVYADLLADRPRFEPGRPSPTLLRDDLALTSTVLADGAVTAEVARRQPDGTWLWAIDHPRIAQPS
jgi:hypothetical protein